MMDLSSSIYNLNEILQKQDYSKKLLLSHYHCIYQSLKNYYKPNAALLLALKIINLIVGKYGGGGVTHNRPYGLIIDPANGCNLHCPGCVHSLSQTKFDWPNGLLTNKSYNDFLDMYGPYSCFAFLYNYGEPFLNPLTPNMIKKTKEYLLRTHISSNLSIKGLDYESIVASGLDYLIVSLDGVSQDVYSKYRKNGNVDLVLNNMCSLISKKRQLGVKRPYIVWQYLVFEHNVHETDLAKKIASEIGVDELHLAKPYSVSWDYPDIIVKEKFNNERIHYSEYIPHLINDIKALPNIEEKQLDFTLFENLIPISSFDKTVKNHNKKCSFLYNTITLDANNRILPCCTSPVKGKKSLIFDHFSDNNYSFNNEFYIEARKQAFTLSGQECSADKTYCHYCSYNGTGMFTTHEEGRAYLLNIGNCEINNCMNNIINKPQ